jgi:hypothetical protein
MSAQRASGRDEMAGWDGILDRALFRTVSPTHRVVAAGPVRRAQSLQSQPRVPTDPRGRRRCDGAHIHQRVARPHDSLIGGSVDAPYRMVHTGTWSGVYSFPAAHRDVADFVLITWDTHPLVGFPDGALAASAASLIAMSTVSPLSCTTRR